MPFTSTQVSGLVGGQQVMFANQATFANQIGGNANAMMANPYPSPSYGVAGLDPGSPDIGTKLAGGLSSSISALGAGASMGASLLGYHSPLGLLDPFTGVSRAFGAGTGGSLAARAGVMAGGQGMGLAYGGSGIAGAFAQGGMRAGLGALGGGLAGAALAAAPYYAAYKGLSALGEQAYEGVQNVQDVRRMTTQYFQPQYGQPGATMGGRPASSMIKDMTSFMHEIASEDTMTSMRDMRKLMDRAGSSGMLQGVGDVNQFKERFRSIVSRTKAVAQILGTTLEEAMPIVNQLQQMGTWTAKDVLGAAVMAKATGPGGAAAMAGSMQQGAQMSYQMGGRLESGAALGQQLFGQISAATRAGIFSQNDIRNMTGGVGGAEGQRMVAGSVQQVMSGMGQTAMGRLMMAGLGEVKGNEFTGRMDEGLLAKFQRGEIGMGELQQMGQKRIHSSKDLATSFFNRSDELGQSMAQQGGLASMAQGVQQSMVHAGYGSASSPIQNRFIQMLTGSSQKQADIIQKLIKELPKIMAEQERANSAALDDSFRQLDERRNRSLAGLKDAVKHSINESVGRPIQELSENLTANMSDSVKRFTDKIMGRTSGVSRVGLQQGLMLSQQGALTGAGPKSWEDLGIKNVGQDFVSGSAFSNTISRVREGQWGAALTGGLGELSSPTGQALIDAGLSTRTGKAGAGDLTVGRGLVASKDEVTRAASRALSRSVDPTMGGMLGGETPAKRASMEKVKTKLRELLASPQYSSELRQAKENMSPGDYAKFLMSKLEKDGATKEAIAELARGTPGGKVDMVSKFDVVSVAQAEADMAGGPKSVAFGDIGKVAGSIGRTPEEVAEYRDTNVTALTDIAAGKSSAALTGAKIGGVLGILGGLPGAMIGAAIGGGIGKMVELSQQKVGRADIEAALKSDKYSVQDIIGHLQKKQTAFSNVAASGKDAAATKLEAALSGMSEDQKKEFIKGLEKEGNVQSVQLRQQTQEKMAAAAASGGPITHVSGVHSATLAGGLEEARQAFEKKDLVSGLSKLEDVAGREKLSRKDVDLLLSGRGGEAGRHVGRLSAISGMKDMNRAQLDKFRERLNIGGVDIFTPETEKRVEEMLKSGGKISGAEVSELKDMLKKTAPGALGQGPGSEKTAAEKSQLEYIQANTKFVEAVNKALGGKLETPKELTNPNASQKTN